MAQWMKEFHFTATWSDAAKMVDGFYKRFEEELKETPEIRRFVQFAGRIVFEHAPEELPPEKQEAMKRYIAAHVLNPDTSTQWMTVAKARKELEQIERERNSGKAKWAEVSDTQIRALKLYYTSIEKEFAAYLPPASNDNTFAPNAGKIANDKFKP